MVSEDGEHKDEQFLLADYRWYAAIPEELMPRLTRFADEAADFDREAGFTRLTRLAARSPADANRHLVAYTSAPDDVIVAYLAITHVDDKGAADVTFVVAPQYRSRGIATLLMERLRDESDECDECDDENGWFGTGASQLRFAAHGPHPAAERLAARFGARQVSERRLLVRALRTPVDAAETTIATSDSDEPIDGDECREPTYELALGARKDTRSVHRRTYASKTTEVVVRWPVDGAGRADRTAFLEFHLGPDQGDDGAIDPVLRAALSDLLDAGMGTVIASIDPRDARMVNACKRSYFHHDQSNLVFAARVPPPAGG